MASSGTTRGRHARGSVLTFGSRTDVGLVRDHNEDSLVVRAPFFAVADGMGGHAAGEVASEIAVQTLSAEAPSTADADNLARAVVSANRNIIRAAQSGKGRKGMGTTVTAAIVEGKRLVVAQVGDSRAYLLHEGSLQRITRDHSLVADLVESGQITEEEARVHPNRSVITRALGSDSHTLPDIYELNVNPGDRLMICSDGLSSMVPDEGLEKILAGIADPQACADKLVAAALREGGHDNVTTIVVDIPGDEERVRRRVSRKSRISAIFGLIIFLAVIAGAVFGGNAYLNHVAFLTANDTGEVVICRGLPGKVLGFQTWEVDTATGVSVEDLDLPTTTIERLTTEGIRVDSVEDAEGLLATWQEQAKDSTATPGASSADAAVPGAEGATFEEMEDPAADLTDEEQQALENSNVEAGGNAVAPSGGDR
ncbi:Stp1/IreP family PP2C-type Ser/Thr phosphatase [Slackia heliotrinireducens]|jgi:protein phosphatase|uniref:Stp1/IreP family PP2C-type Ser/Thr phosphatase n=1 Tax=Slackia heliotrinireducens TaxID=84110 RepID=UPI0033148DBB